MKILIFWEQDYYGGVDTHIYELLRTWPNKKDEITILTNLENKGIKKFYTTKHLFKNVKIEKFNSFSHNILNYKYRNFKFLQYLLYLLVPLLFYLNLKILYKKILKFKKYDVILCNNGGYPASWGCICSLIVSKAIGIKKRYLLVHHEASNFFPFMRWFHKKIDKLVSQSATKIICISKATKESLKKNRFLNLKNKNYKIIHNSLEIKNIKKKPIFNLRKFYNINNSKILMGIVSRVEPYKGHADFLIALSKINKSELNKLYVLIIGKGNPKYLKYLKNLNDNLKLNRNVFFTGYLNASSEEIISQLDLLINPTQTFEGYGLSILEAINVRTPVIATDVGAIREVFGSNNIMLARKRDINSLKKKILIFIKNKKFYKNKASLVFKKFKKKYHPMSKNYYYLFKKEHSY